MTDKPVQFGRYVLVERLGVGGMAEVWRARVEGAGGFSRDLVVKRIMGALLKDSEFAVLFEREARLSARLSHSNIVQVFEYGDVNGEPFLAMEFVDGVDVHRLMKRGATPSPGIAAFIARELGRALKHVHEVRGEDGQPLGLVHRDISPSNIMLGVDGSVKLFDFGIARTLSESGITKQGAFRGKIAYSAPEVVEGGTHDARSDLFALGVVLHELLTAKRLFASGSDVETFAKVHAANVPLVTELAPHVPASLEAVCMRLLSRLPGDRFENAQAFLAAIDPIVHELSTGPEQLAALVVETRARAPLEARAAAVPVAPPGPATRSFDIDEPKPRSRLPVVVGAVAALGLIISAAVMLLPRADTVATLDAGVVAVVVPPRVEPTPAPDPVSPTVKTRALRIESKPQGATVKTMDGSVLGTTPLEGTWSTAERPTTVVLERKGFARVPITIPTDVERVEVVLRPQQSVKKKKGSTANLKGGDTVDPFK